MKNKALIGLLILAAIVAVRMPVQTQTNTKGVYFNAAAPATCNVGELWCDTDDGALYSCTAVNTWTAVASGGGAPTTAQYVVSAADAGLSAEDVLTGTANQITVTNAVGTSTLSLPQPIATTSTPQFAALGLGVAAGSSGLLQIMGTGSGTATLGGIANKQFTTVGNVGSGEDDLMTYSLPANSLSANGMGVDIDAFGSIGNTGNTKTLRAYFGTLELMTLDTANSGGSWNVKAIVMRNGASSQITYCYMSFYTDASAFVDEGMYVLAGSESLAGAVTIKITAEATSNDDLVQHVMLVRTIH